MEYFTLSNGLKIPAVGSGTNTFAKTDNVYDGHTTEVVSALEAGYRFFDTAEGYRNEEAIGSGVIESGVPRSEVFLCTKMSNREERVLGPEDTVASVERSLAKLKTDYIDLYLLHFPRPTPEETAAVWEGFEACYEKGILKAIGVCNFQPEQLERLIADSRIPPMVLQVRRNPETWNVDAIECAKRNGLIPMAWGPLRFDEKYRPALQEIGAKYGKNWAQTILRYHFQTGCVTIPKSHSFAHQKENLDIFDFALTDAELAAIAAL